MLFRPSTRTTLKHKALLLQKEPKPLIWSYDPETPKPFSSSNPQLQEAKPCNPKRLGPFVVRASQNPYNSKTLNPQPENPPASQLRQGCQCRLQWVPRPRWRDCYSKGGVDPRTSPHQLVETLARGLFLTTALSRHRDIGLQGISPGRCVLKTSTTWETRRRWLKSDGNGCCGGGGSAVAGSISFVLAGQSVRCCGSAVLAAGGSSSRGFGTKFAWLREGIAV